MNARMLMVSIAALATIVVTPVLAGPLTCGRNDQNGCSVSPVTLRSCQRDIRGDTIALQCTLANYTIDLYSRNRGALRSDIAAITAALQELGMDYAKISKVLTSLPR